MRERMDFSAISKIILDNRKAGCLSNTEYYRTLFGYAFAQSDIVVVEPDNGIISRTIRGQRNVVKDILALYQQEENQKYLLEGVRKVLKDVADPDCIGEQLEHLLWNDSTISIEKKQKGVMNHLLI